jgi:hypothetical protein
MSANFDVPYGNFAKSTHGRVTYNALQGYQPVEGLEMQDLHLD